MLKRFIVYLTVLTMIFTFAVGIKAEGETDTKDTGTKLTDEDFDMTKPVPSTHDIEKWGERKGNELVKLAQKWAVPALQLFFVLGAIMVVIGAISKSKMLGAGFKTMLVSLMMYSFIKFAPMVFDAWQAWVKS